MAHRQRRPSWLIVDEERCDTAFDIFQDDPEGFMCQMVKIHFRRSEQLLNYKILKNLKRQIVTELERIYSYYFEAYIFDAVPREAVKRALSKCRFYRRQKIYKLINDELEGNFVAITYDYDCYYYAPHVHNPNQLAPYSDPDYEMRLPTRYYLDEKFGIPTRYRYSEFIIVFEKDEEGILISFINPRTRFITSVYKRNKE